MTVGEEAAPSAAEEAPAVVGKIEADLFCAQCQYNLFGLDVFKDARLGIPLVRCPECGKFHPAGVASGAGRVWLHRLARFLIATWVLFAIGVVAASALGFFILDVINFDAFTRYREAAGTWTFVPSEARDFPSPIDFYFLHALFATACAALGCTLGAFLSVFLFQVRRPFHLWTLALIGMAGALALQLYVSEMSRRSPHAWTWAVPMTARAVFFQAAGVVAGVVAGRAAARFLLWAILTRRLLQYVRFLWEIDGKTPPRAAAA
jgi:hypothetical protein